MQSFMHKQREWDARKMKLAYSFQMLIVHVWYLKTVRETNYALTVFLILDFDFIATNFQNFTLVVLGGAEMKKIILLIITLFGLAACVQFSQSEELITPNHSIFREQAAITTSRPPKKEPFTAIISVPNQIKSNEKFVVEATLKNSSLNDLNILHASGVFYFSIKDINGKDVNTFVMSEVGKVRTIQGEGTITERYIYKLEKPGFYEVSATAKFLINEGENGIHFEVETNKASFEVIPPNPDEDSKR